MAILLTMYFIYLRVVYEFDHVFYLSTSCLRVLEKDPWRSSQSPEPAYMSVGYTLHA
jgi:hypothetical protein